jgi:hypothetical protein
LSSIFLLKAIISTLQYTAGLAFLLDADSAPQSTGFLLSLAVANVLTLTGLLIREGNFRAPRLDFNSWRAESLKGLEQYLPAPPIHRLSGWSTGNAIKYNLAATASHLKNSYRSAGGHLAVPALKLFYIRIPKAGSTSVASVMLNLIIPEIKETTLNSTQINFLTDGWLQTSTEGLSGYAGFSLVRHPLIRLASVYHDIFERDDVPFIYQNYLGGILRRDLSFDEFVLRISRIPDRFKDQHFKPQHHFIQPYQKKNLPVTVLRLEDKETIDGFLKTYHLQLPHLNKAIEYDYRKYYQQNSLQTVLKMYVHDFKLFGYEQRLAPH